VNSEKYIKPLSVTACDNETVDDTGNDTGDDTEVDSDTLGEFPTGDNLLISTYSNGTAEVYAITAYDHEGVEDLTQVYDDAINSGCDNSWGPQGPLCEDNSSVDSAALSVREDADVGATGEIAKGGLPTTGVLLVDACFDASCTDIEFNSASIFQMFSDGKTTDFQMSVHTTTEDLAPAWDDAGWTEVLPWTDIGPGLSTDDGVTVTAPTVRFFDDTTARYIKFEAMNNGIHGDSDYIELRSVKLYLDD
jgi:hypothetical protein